MKLNIDILSVLFYTSTTKLKLMISIIYQGKHVELGNILGSLTELKDIQDRLYFQKQLAYICIRNKAHLSPENLNVLWDCDPDIFLKLSRKYNQKNLLSFRERYFDDIKDNIKNFEGLLPRVLDVIRQPVCYFDHLYTILKNTYGEPPEYTLELITPETITQVDKYKWNPLIFCLRYCTDPQWIPIAEQLITSETVTHVNNNGWNPLLLCLRYCTDPQWIPVAERLINPETITQVDKYKWNPLMLCLLYCTNPKWIPVAERLITPETVKQVNIYKWNPLMFCLAYCIDPKWIPVATKRLITSETVKQVNKDNQTPLMLCLLYRTNPKWIPVAEQLITPETVTQVNNYGVNPLMYCLRNCINPKWIPVVERLITPETVTHAGSNKLIKLINKCQNSQWNSLIDLIEQFA